MNCWFDWLIAGLLGRTLSSVHTSLWVDWVVFHSLHCLVGWLVNRLVACFVWVCVRVVFLLGWFAGCFVRRFVR